MWPKFRYYDGNNQQNCHPPLVRKWNPNGSIKKSKKRLTVICFSAIFLELQQQYYIPINAGLCERYNVISNSEKEDLASFYCCETLPVTFRVELCVPLPYCVPGSLLSHQQWRVTLPFPPCAVWPLHLKWGHTLSHFDCSGGATEKLWYALRCPWTLVYRSARCLAGYYSVI